MSYEKLAVIFLRQVFFYAVFSICITHIHFIIAPHFQYYFSLKTNQAKAKSLRAISGQESFSTKGVKHVGRCEIHFLNEAQLFLKHVTQHHATIKEY